jgi:hypothetical protein
MLMKPRIKEARVMFDFHRKSDLVEIQRSHQALADARPNWPPSAAPWQ